MLWEHDGDMHHAWEDDDLNFNPEAAAEPDRALRHKGRSRAKIMQDVPDNVLERGDRHNKASRTVYEH